MARQGGDPAKEGALKKAHAEAQKRYYHKNLREVREKARIKAAARRAKKRAQTELAGLAADTRASPTPSKKVWRHPVYTEEQWNKMFPPDLPSSDLAVLWDEEDRQNGIISTFSDQEDVCPDSEDESVMRPETPPKSLNEPDKDCYKWLTFLQTQLKTREEELDELDIANYLIGLTKRI